MKKQLKLAIYGIFFITITIIFYWFDGFNITDSQVKKETSHQPNSETQSKESPASNGEKDHSKLSNFETPKSRSNETESSLQQPLKSNPYASMDGSKKILKATSKYLGTLLSKIKNPDLQVQTLKDEALLYLEALNLRATEQQSGHVKTGLRNELIFKSTRSIDDTAESGSLSVAEFVLSLSAPTETNPGRFNRQDVFLIGNKEHFESLVAEITTETGRPPIKRNSIADQLPEYAEWIDEQIFYLFVAAEPATDEQDSDPNQSKLKIRISIEERIE